MLRDLEEIGDGTQGKKVVDEEGIELVSRKRARGVIVVSQGPPTRRRADGVCGGNVGKTLTIVGTRGPVCPPVNS